RRYGLEARDRQQPCRYRRAPFEPASLTPHVEKYLADHVLRGSLIANETNDEPKHPHVVARKQHLHGEPIAVRDPSDQHLVWCRLHFGLVFSRTRLPLGSRKASGLVRALTSLALAAASWGSQRHWLARLRLAANVWRFVILLNINSAATA